MLARVPPASAVPPGALVLALDGAEREVLFFTAVGWVFGALMVGGLAGGAVGYWIGRRR